MLILIKNHLYCYKRLVESDKEYLSSFLEFYESPKGQNFITNVIKIEFGIENISNKKRSWAIYDY